MNAPSAPSMSKDNGKKKRTNRYAKLKQCKLDVRREQWLSQVRSNGGKEQSNGDSSPSSHLPVTRERNEPLDKLEHRSRPEENEDSSLHDSDSESLANSPNNGPLKDRHICSGSSVSGSYSGSISEEEEEDRDDDCLDDWEAIADALNSEAPARTEHQPEPTLPPDCPTKPCVAISGTSPRPMSNCRAWRPDDAFRPQSLPNLSKQHSFPITSDRHVGCGPAKWAHVGKFSPPSSCPICYEDLDLTDSSFCPCPCGFLLCLFCHKRILEADGRCPGCRKPYGPVEASVVVNVGAPQFRLARSCSTSTRY